MTFTYSMIAATDTGNVRAANEDSLRVIPSINLAVIADGMGGHKAGDIASRMAVDSLCEHFQEQALVNDALGTQGTMDVMADAFSLANSQVYANSHQFSNYEGMGTTLISASCQPDQIQFGHIGDSRAYRFCRGKIEQLSVDHTLATELSVDTPAWELPAYSHHVLRKALGIESSCSPDFFTVKPENDEIFLLCSDGLTGVLEDEEISTILALRSHQPEHCLETLIDACVDGGAPDNISVILIYVTVNSSLV